MERCSVRLLGTFSLNIENGVKRFPTQKATELFAFLLLAQKRVSREVVAAALWPDVNGEGAKKQLRTTLWRLRRALSVVPGARLDSEAAALSLDCPLEVDAIRFEVLVNSLDRVPPLEQAT